LIVPHTRLARFEHRTEWPLAGVAVIFLALYSVQVLARPHGIGSDVLRFGLAVT